MRQRNGDAVAGEAVCAAGDEVGGAEQQLRDVFAVKEELGALVELLGESERERNASEN